MQIKPGAFRSPAIPLIIAAEERDEHQVVAEHAPWMVDLVELRAAADGGV
jgi:hypothetical protein